MGTIEQVLKRVIELCDAHTDANPQSLVSRRRPEHGRLHPRTHPLMTRNDFPIAIRESDWK